MRYLPFIIISLVLYTLFFYNNQQPELLSNGAISPVQEKVVPLDFEQLLTQDKKINKEAPLADDNLAHVELAVTPTPSIEAVEPAVIATQPPAKSRDSLKIRLASFKSVPASDVAQLRGELYELDFYLHLPAPPQQKKAPKKIKAPVKKAAPPKKVSSKAKVQAKSPVSQDSVSSELLKMQQSSSTTEAPKKTTTASSDKPKRSFKKQVKTVPVSNEKGLQEAIAVSGNKPHYPKNAKAKKQQGQVTVEFTVSMQGKTRNTQIIKSSGYKSLDSAVLEFIKKERFMPALKGIEKVTSQQQYSFTFSEK